ncbi:MAG TPA: hypothetical protein VF406_11550, partial [Thermodesulfobacteriota bacterium]
MIGQAYLEDRREASRRSLILVMAILLGSALVFTLLTAPFTDLLGESRGAVPSVYHAMAAFIYLVVGTVGLYLAWQLWTGRVRSVADLQLLSTVSATLAFLAIVAGNWLYIYYRAKDPASPRSYFLANAPAVHRIFFEFKEFAALFTLPITVAAAFLLWYYGAEALDRKWMRYTLAVLFTLSFFYLAVAFGLGAAVTKLR